MTEQAKTIAQRVRELVASEAGGIPIERVRDDMALEDHAPNYLDSLGRVEFVMGLEDEFGIEIPDVDAQRLDKLHVSEWIQYVEARRSAAAL